MVRALVLAVVATASFLTLTGVAAAQPMTQQQFLRQRQQAGRIPPDQQQAHQQLTQRCMMAVRRSGGRFQGGRTSGITALQMVDQCVASGGPRGGLGPGVPDPQRRAQRMARRQQMRAQGLLPPTGGFGPRRGGGY